MISRWFLRLAVLFGLTGMGMGVVMGATHDFTLSPVHAHINLVGWVGMFLAGLFYAAKPAAETKLAAVHLIGLTLGLVLLSGGLAGIRLGNEAFTPVVGIGSVVTLASMTLFVWIVFRHTGPAKVAAE